MCKKEKPGSLVSFILPVRNAAATLQPVLRAVSQYDDQPHEIIVVDDGSTDRTAIIAERHATRVIRSDRSHGPADARNRAAEAARGHILFFLDSDVRVTVPMIKRIVALTRLHPECLGVSTAVSRKPLNKGFFPRLRALQECCDHEESLNSDEPTEFPYIQTRCGTLWKADFDAVGGFDPRFRTPGLEDLDLSLRLWGHRRFLYVSDLRVRHHWRTGFVAMWRRCFRDSFLWASRIRPRPGSFTRAPAPARRATAALAGLGALFLIAFAFLLPGWVPSGALAGSAILLIAHVILNWPMYRYFRRKAGFLFTLCAAVYTLIFSVPAAVGCILGSFVPARQPKLTP